MSRHGHTDLVERWFQEVWSEGGEDRIDELAAGDVIFHSLGRGVRGTAEYKQFRALIWQNFRDLRVEVVHAMSHGDMHAVHCRVTGFHRATGRAVDFAGGGFARVANGRLAEVWDAWNFLRMTAQIDPRAEDLLVHAVTKGQAVI